MPVNTGFTETAFDPDAGGAPQLVVRFYYDSTAAAGSGQPLINGPRGYCLDVTNTTGATVPITVTNGAGQSVTGSVATGNPAVGRGNAVGSMTAAQLAKAGFATRGDVQSLTLTPA